MRLILIFLLTLTISGCVTALAERGLYPFDLVNSRLPSTKEIAHYPNQNGPVIFYLHGNGENIEGLEKSGFTAALSKLGYLTVPEYPGLGPLSAQKPSQETIMAQVRKHYTDLRKDWSGTGRKIVIIGRSLGAAVAAQLAKMENPDGLILISPWTKFEDAARATRFGFLTNIIDGDFVGANSWDTIAAMTDYKGKVSVIHGTSDTLIPIAQGRSVARVLKISITEVPSDHNNIFSKQETWNAIQGALK